MFRTSSRLLPLVALILPLAAGDWTLFPEGRTVVLGEGIAVERQPTDSTVVSLSAVKGQKARKAVVTVRNPSAAEMLARVEITGKDAGLFKASAANHVISAGGETTVTLEFVAPDSPGRFSAGLQIGGKAGGAFVILQGVGLAAFEGKNEPALQSIVHALGIPLRRRRQQAGAGHEGRGDRRERCDPRIPRRGGWENPHHASRAVFSERRDALRHRPFRRSPAAGNRQPRGLLRRDPGRAPDALSAARRRCRFRRVRHAGQAVRVLHEGPEVRLVQRSRDQIRRYHPAHRADLPGEVFPRPGNENSWLIGFEEAANGDYQDAVFLVENAKPANP